MYTELKKKHLPSQKNTCDKGRDVSTLSKEDSELLSGEKSGAFDVPRHDVFATMGHGQLAMQFKRESENSGASRDTDQSTQRNANNTGLPDKLKAGIENLSGYCMDDVKVHYNSAKPAQLQAHAYAQGTDIHVGPGQEKYLPHEAWHVVQQKQGRVRPMVQMKGKVSVNNEAILEKEADRMGAKAMNSAFSEGQSQLTCVPRQQLFCNETVLQRRIIPTVNPNYLDTPIGKQRVASILLSRETFTDQEKELFFRPVEDELSATNQNVSNADLQHAKLRAVYKYMRENRSYGPTEIFSRRDSALEEARVELKNAYDLALAYMWRSGMAREIYRQVDNHDRDVTINIGAETSRAEYYSVDWNPWELGMLTTVIPPAQNTVMNWSQVTGVISAATLLFHELGHIKQDMEAEDFVSRLQNLNIPNIMQIRLGMAGSASAGKYAFEALLFEVHHIVRPFIGNHSPVFDNPHRNVMEPDNVSRHERPTTSETREPPRANYDKTAKVANFAPNVKSAFKQFGLTPKNLPRPDFYMGFYDVHNDQLIVPPDQLNKDIETHLEDILGLLPQRADDQAGLERARRFVEFVIAYWQEIKKFDRLSAKNEASGPAPTFQRPGLNYF